jgi:ribosomal protein L16 Arg81 hydroxylase
MTGRAFTLESLLAPRTLEEFFSDYWEKAPLLISHREPARYRALLEVSDIDFILSSAFTGDKAAVEALGTAEVEKSLKEISAGHISEFYDAYRRGSTVRVNRVHRHWKPIRELCRSLEQLLNCPIRANLYCTPASASTSTRHYDTHDVLVLQISGCKSWRLFKPLVQLPLEGVPPLPFEERTPLLKYARGGPRKARANIDDDECEPLSELLLTAGDLMYIPRGFLHEAWTTDEPSTHLTVGLHVVRWLDLLSVALAQLSNRDVRFRQALPTGHGAGNQLEELFTALARDFARQANLKEAAEELAGSFVQSRQAVGDGMLAASVRVADIDRNTLLEHRPGLLCRFAQNGGAVGIVSAHIALWMPPVFDEALRFIVMTREFRAGEIPGSMTETSKLSLARRLLHDGFVRIAGEVG